MSRNALLCVLALSFGCFNSSVRAEATHSLVRPPVAIQPSKAQLPIPLVDALANKTVGLDFESADSAKVALKQAKDYIQYRRGGWKRAQIEAWENTCEEELSSKNQNPFCRIEQERAAQTGSYSRLGAKARRARRALASELKTGDFSKVTGHTYSEVVGAVGTLGEKHDAIVELAKKAAASTTCLPETITTALASKLEEDFPDKDIVDLSKSLYRKSVECGKDVAMATAAFRLGLILVWQKQFAEVDSLMRKVEAVPEAQPLHARAKYWRYQAAIALGNEAVRKEMKEALLRSYPMTFQNLVVNGADENSGLDREMPSVFTRSLIRPDMNAILRAAEALDRAGSSQLAAEVFDRSVNDIATLEPEVRLYSAAFLHRIGYSLPKFKILSSLFQDQPKLVTASTMELMFPLSYVDLVKKNQSSIDPLLFLSLMRQESAFNPDARSGVGARGLMQVMPATARLIRRVRKNQLFKPEINIEVGTKVFVQSLNKFDGDVELTLASYNAGNARVDQWRKRYPTDNKILFLDFIPFRETRDYVSSILRNYYWYTRLYSPEAAPAKPEPGKIAAPSGRVQAILAANAGTAARLTANDRTPSSAAPIAPSN